MPVLITAVSSIYPQWLSCEQAQLSSFFLPYDPFIVVIPDLMLGILIGIILLAIAIFFILNYIK